MGIKLIIVGIFVLVLAYVAYRSTKMINNYQDYNLAGKNTGLFALTATLVAAEFNTATLIGGASVAYLFGTVGIWYTSLIFIIVFSVYALTVSKKYRRLNISTIPEFFEKRFSKGRFSEPLRLSSTFITLFYTWLAPASYLAGITVIGHVLLGIDPITFSIIVVALCLILSITGGLITAIGIDIVAFIMILIGIPSVLVIGLIAADGFASLSQVYDPKLLSLKPVWDTEVNFPIALTWGLQITFLYIAAPWYGQRVFSAKNDGVAFKAMIFNTILLVVLYGMAVIATMLSKVVMPNLSSPEQALPLLIANHSPAVVQGLLLVMLLLVGVSTMIAVWNSAISIILNDLVKRYLFKNKSEFFYINASRVGMGLIALSTLVLGIIFIGNIQNSLLYLSVFTGMVAIPILMSVYWRRFNSVGALATMAVGLTYSTIALLNSFPTYFISPIGAILSLFAGIVATLLTTEKEQAINDSKEFFDIINSSMEEDKKVIKENEFSENKGGITSDI